jgi:signal transduction histidine kinase
LHEASKAIVEGFATSRRELLDRLVEQAVQCMGVDIPKARLAFLQIYDPKRNVLSCECTYPLTVRAELTARLGQERHLGRDQSPDGRVGISGRAAQTGRSYLVADVRRDPDYLEVDPTIRSELAVPLMDRGKAIGVLSIESDQLNAFDENDRATLEGLAALSVIAIRNAEHAEELNRSNLVAVMGVWGAEIAHDAKEEVGAIRRAVNILQNREDLPHEARAWLQEIDASAETLSLPLLPAGLPAFGQAVSQLDPAPLDETLLSEVVWLRHRYHDAEWLTDFKAPNVRVAMHHRWLRQLVRHLGRNAYQALPEIGSHGAGTITVRTRAEKGMARIEVEDTGRGVQPDIRSLLFEAQVPHGGDRPPGRGLLLVSYLVQQHGGEVMLVRSEVGVGSCFALVIPISSPNNSADAAGLAL